MPTKTVERDGRIGSYPVQAGSLVVSNRLIFSKLFLAQFLKALIDSCTTEKCCDTQRACTKNTGCHCYGPRVRWFNVFIHNFDFWKISPCIRVNIWRFLPLTFISLCCRRERRMFQSRQRPSHRPAFRRLPFAFFRIIRQKMVLVLSKTEIISLHWTRVR